MKDFEYLQELEKISPTNGFIQYIVKRVLSDDYRGVQCSQHNRLTYNYFSKLISAIYEIAGDSVFDIHIGDDDGILQPQAATYYAIVNKIKEIVGKGTINSVKKNTFPDIARMGFLDRYDKNDVKITEGSRKSVIYGVGLSDSGVRFAEAKTFEKIKLFTDGVDRITKNTASDLVELLCLNDYGIDYIDILEFMYILSDDRNGITTNDKLRYLIDYRSLSPVEKDKVNECLKNYCNPLNRKALNNKTYLRDYNNWKNESQQIFGLLANSTYFKVENNKLILNTGNYGIFNEQTTRSEKAKSDYFKNHNVTKRSGFELHHIIPISKAQNKSDVTYIDDYKNLIYLSAGKHSEFTKTGNKNVILKYAEDNPNLIFLDFKESFILVNTETDALLSRSNLKSIKDYNTLLLKKFYYTKQS